LTTFWLQVISLKALSGIALGLADNKIEACELMTKYQQLPESYLSPTSKNKRYL